MKGLWLSFLVALVLLVGGCWTFSQSEYPQVAVTAAKGDVAKQVIAVTGFEATVVDYQTFQSYTSVYVPGYAGRHCYHPGYYEVVPTCTVVPQARVTEHFLRRAREQLEDAGFALASAQSVPEMTVEVNFEGPFVNTDDVCASVGWMLCTVFFCDYSAAEWTAKLRIRNNRTGKIVFTRTYSQRYETKVFGLVPIFSILSCDETKSSFIQGWCLSALTDRTVSEATSFLSSFKID